ncbi:MAG TPA: hypothetical protein VJR29_12355 [bacterium]|nr:hypothetical protein [bacterium]
MTAASALAKAGRFAALALLMAISVACGSGNGNEPDPSPSPTPSPSVLAAGDYFVSGFVATNDADAGDFVEGSAIGLSIYFVLNADGSLSGAGQTPSEPPAASPFTGTWEQDGNNLSLIFADGDGNVRTITGTLSESAEGEVSFQGSQSSGAPLILGDESATYSITEFEMQKYEQAITGADLTGEWNAVLGTAFSNEDFFLAESLLQNGAALRVVFTQEGVLQVFNTFEGGGEDNFEASYTLDDNFHLTLTVEDEPQTIVFSLIDGVLVIYIYDSSRDFDNDSVSTDIPATLVYTLEQT